MLSFLKLIKYKNLLTLVFIQFVFKYGFLKLQNIPLALKEWPFLLFVIATVCITAAYYLISPVFEDSKNNNSHFISENKIYNYYIILNIIGVGIGFYLANLIGKPNFSALFIVISATLYVYASSLQQTLLVGNFINSVLFSLWIIVTGVFNLLPMITISNQPIMIIIFQIMIDYAIFCFILHFIGELVKDLSRINDNYNSGKNTLAIILGFKRAKKLTLTLSIIPITVSIYYLYTYLSNLEFALTYAVLFIVIPLLFFSIKIGMAKTQRDFNFLNMILEGIFILSIFSIVIITLNKYYYA